MANVIDLRPPASRPPASYSPLTQGKVLVEDFLVANLASGNIQLSDFSTLGVNSGRLSLFLYQANINLFGVAKIASSSTANSGAIIASYANPMYGADKYVTVVNFLTNGADTTGRFGFFTDTNYKVTMGTVKAGVYFSYANGALTGNIAFNKSNTVATSGTFTIDTSKFYRLEITTTWKQGGHNNYYATFKVFDGTNVVFNETISLNYYIASYGPQYASAAVIILNSGTTATTMLYIDYLEYGITRKLER